MRSALSIQQQNSYSLVPRCYKVLSRYVGQTEWNEPNYKDTYTSLNRWIWEKKLRSDRLWISFDSKVKNVWSRRRWLDIDKAVIEMSNIGKSIRRQSRRVLTDPNRAREPIFYIQIQSESFLLFTSIDIDIRLIVQNSWQRWRGSFIYSRAAANRLNSHYHFVHAWKNDFKLTENLKNWFFLSSAVCFCLLRNDFADRSSKFRGNSIILKINCMDSKWFR